MTISSTTSSVILNADGSTHNFSFNFKILSATDLKVIVRSTTGVETEKTLNSQYIIPSSSIGQDSGGNVLFKYNTGDSGDAHYSATDYRPANGEKVILRRQPVQEQQLNLVNNDPFNAELIEESLDKLTMQVQALQEEVDRTFRLSRTNILDKDGAQINNAFFQLSDDVASRKGKFLQFNSTTGVIEPSATSDDVTTIAAVTTDIALLADIQDGTSATNTLTVVSGISGNVTTCASISSDITSVAGISGNVTTVAGKASLITSDFASDLALIDSTFVTNMNLVTSDFVSDVNLITSDFISDMSLITADFIADINTVATSDIITDFNTLATSDIVADMNLLATSSNITAMANLGVSSVITNMANLNASGVVSNIGTVAGSISNIATVAAADSNISALNASGVIANIATVAGANSNITTVASNISGVNSFADRYRIASSAPTSSLDAGDLYFDTSTNKLNVYSGSNWQSTAEAAQRTVTTHNVTSAGTQTISVSYTVGLVDIYLNGLKLNISEGDATASNGTSVVVTGASVGDIIEVVALSAFNAANYGTAASKNVGIGNDNIPVFTSGVSDNDFLKIDGSSVEGRSASEVLSDIGGQASLTFGIANTNAVKIDHASVASTDYAKFTSNGLEGKSFAEVRSDLNVADGANAYVHPNHSGEVTSTADGATVIADNVVDEANLKVSNTPTNGYFLSAQSGNTGGLTWAAVASGGAWEEVAGGDFSGVTSITQSFSQDYVYRVLLFNLQLDNANINNSIFPAIQLNYGAGAGTAVTIRHSRISLAANSTTWSNNSYNTLTRGAISNSNPIRANGNNSNQTSATYDLYITQPSASGTYAAHAWTACRWWCTSWGYYDSATGYSKYGFAEGAETSNTGSYNVITSFKILDNGLTSYPFSGTYRILRIGAS